MEIILYPTICGKNEVERTTSELPVIEYFSRLFNG